MVTRRGALRLAGSAVFVLAGCQAIDGRNERTEPATVASPPRTTTEPRTTAEPTTTGSQGAPTETRTGDCPARETPSGGASLAIRNRLDGAVRGTVSVRRTGDGVTFEGPFELASGEGVLNGDVFTEAGDYEIELSVASGPSENWTTSLPDENRAPLGAYSVEVVVDEEARLRVLHGDPAPTPPGC